MGIQLEMASNVCCIVKGLLDRLMIFYFLCRYWYMALFM